MNSFGYGEATSGDETGSGLWGLASFMNHSGAPNTFRYHCGAHMFIKAAKALKRGNEVTTTYIADENMDKTKRGETLLWTWGIMDEQRGKNKSAGGGKKAHQKKEE